MPQRQRGPAPLPAPARGREAEALPEPRGHHVQSVPDSSFKEKKLNQHDTVSLLLPFLMGGDSAQLLDCGDTWL